MSLRPTVDFLLHDWLKVERLQSRERFADHSRETFDAVLDTCERIAREKYAPFNRLVDTQEPHFDGEKVILPQATHDAYKAYAESGMLSAAQDYDVGGMQLPYTVEAAANAFFAMASVSIGSGMLTSGNANLLMVHGTDLQKKVFAANEFSGRFSGTMCLSEPQAGSSLSDITTRATSYHAIGANSNSTFLVFTHAAMHCDGVRVCTLGAPLVTRMDVDVLTGAGWTRVYEGTVLDQQWDTKMFPAMNALQVRACLYIGGNFGTTWDFYELEFHRLGLPRVGSLLLVE